MKPLSARFLFFLTKTERKGKKKDLAGGVGRAGVGDKAF